MAVICLGKVRSRQIVISKYKTSMFIFKNKNCGVDAQSEFTLKKEWKKKTQFNFCILLNVTIVRQGQYKIGS